MPGLVSVIIVTRNSAQHLAASIQAIPAAAGEIPTELIVVDNASKDNSRDIVRQYRSDARIFPNNANVGFAIAANQGAQAATGEWIFFLNPDLLLDAGSLRELVVFAETHIAPDGAPSTFVPRLRLPDGSFHASCRQLPTIRNLLHSRGSLLRRLVDPARPYEIGDGVIPVTVPAVAGTALLISRQSFLSLDGFDPRYFLYMEDTDLSRRVSAAGGQNWFVPAAGAVHHWQEGSREGSVRREWWHHRSLIMYFRKHQRGFASALLLPPLIMGHFLVRAILLANPGMNRNKRA